MQDLAELGVAAHWIYKQGGPSTDAPQYAWLRSLLDILDKAPNAEEFLEHTKLEMFQDQVFCFTPKGKLIALPRGATPVDFAYAVHTEVGDTCVGAKINGRMLPLRTQLSQRRPGRDHHLEGADAVADLGALRRHRQGARPRSAASSARASASSTSSSASRCSTRPSTRRATRSPRRASTACAPTSSRPPRDDLIAAVGAGLITAREVMTAVYPGLKQPQRKDGGADVVPISRGAQQGASGATRRPRSRPGQIAIRGLIPGMAVHFARCCHPLPGDRIVGIITTGKGVTIHTIDCDTLESFADSPERWIDVGWDAVSEGEPGIYTGRLKVTVANQPGSLSKLSTVIARHEGNISNLRIVNRSMDFFDMVIDVEVNDVKHLANITAALRATPGDQCGRARAELMRRRPERSSRPHAAFADGEPSVLHRESAMRLSE